jgi:hypothetical protein
MGDECAENHSEEEEKKEDGEKSSYINMPSKYPKYLKSH